MNSKKFKFDPKKIDFVFIGHAHIDHCGLLPRLVKKGFNGKIITTVETAKIIKPLLLNSCMILKNEARILSKKFKRNYLPIYEENDVYKTYELIETFNDYDTIYKLNENVNFQFLHNSHCVGATQIQLYLRDKGRQRKILYTSDIGKINPKNHYVSKTSIPDTFNDVVIMESTYGEKNRNKAKKRNFDMKCLRSVIENTIDRKGSVILPCFSFSRTQEVLTVLYEIFSNDKDFKVPIIIDSQLSCTISKLYKDVLNDKHLYLWNKVKNWENVRFINNKNESKKCVINKEPKIIISSSGFCTNGRIIEYLKTYLRDINSTIVFTGYTGDNPSYLSYRIKNYREHKKIKINKVSIPNKADCVSLSTFSSHADFNDLVTYGVSVNTNKLILVHGSKKAKNCLAKKLQEGIYKNNKTHRVLESAKDMFVRL